MGERAEQVSLEITGLSVGKLPREHGADRAGGQPMVPTAFFSQVSARTTGPLHDLLLTLPAKLYFLSLIQASP